MTLIKLTGISRVFGKGSGKTVALKDVDLEIKAGDFIAIMGPSGSGKSTLMNIIGLLDTPSEGRQIFEDVDVSQLGDRSLSLIRRKRIGFIFQRFNLLNRHTAVENVILPMVYARIERFRREATAAELLRRVGLKERLYYLPNELSGGEAQRVAIARALANSPSLILADEPTGNLDTDSSKKVMELLKELHEKDGNTIVIVTHDETIAGYAKRLIKLKDGSIESDSAHQKKSKKKSSTAKKATAKKSKKDSKKKESKTKSSSNSKSTKTKKAPAKTKSKKTSTKSKKKVAVQVGDES